MSSIRAFLERLRSWCFQNKKQAFFLIIIFLVGVFLRTYSHGDFLAVKSDQARDLLYLEKVLEGAAPLPLVGPVIGGSSLQLGPAFYYFQIISASIFGVSPESLAYPDLVFGILLLPVSFLLYRRLFSLPVAFGLLSLTSVSLFIVNYARFAWNPNSLPFFTTCFLLCFLYFLDQKQNTKPRWWWLLATAFLFTLIAQLHIFSFIALFLAIVLFFLFYKRLFLWKEVLVAIGIFLLFHVPFIGGFDFKSAPVDFTEDVGEKIATKHTVPETIFRAYQENARAFGVLLVGEDHSFRFVTKGYDLQCDDRCEKNLPQSIFFLVAFTLFGGLFLWLWRKKYVIDRHPIVPFLGLWLLTTFFTTILFAYEIEIRFFLGSATLFFGIMGVVLHFLWEKNIYASRIFVGFFLVGAIVCNLYQSVLFFEGLYKAPISSEKTSADFRFGTETKVVLEQYRAIAEEAEKQFQINQPLIVYGESQHVKAMYYVLRHESGFPGCYIRGNDTEIPKGYQSLRLQETDEEDEKIEGQIFGTMSAQFKNSRTTVDPIEELPKTCLTL